MSDNWLWRVILACIALLFLLALTGTVPAHDIYSNWGLPDVRNAQGKRYQSCCNNQDCAPRPSRFISGHTREETGYWEVQFEGRWVRVPDAKVETAYPDAWEPGDKQSHACIRRYMNSVIVLCFRPGEWLQ